MVDSPPAANQFWLLTGEVPSGPFTVAQIHEMLAAGKATWQTLASLVGEGTWRPLLQITGIGPGTATTARALPVFSTPAPIAEFRDERPSDSPSHVPSFAACSRVREWAIGIFAVLLTVFLVALAVKNLSTPDSERRTGEFHQAMVDPATPWPIRLLGAILVIVVLVYLGRMSAGWTGEADAKYEAEEKANDKPVEP